MELTKEERKDMRDGPFYTRVEACLQTRIGDVVKRHFASDGHGV